MKDKKNKTIAIVLALFLGGFGGHKFYLGKIWLGIAYALFVWTMIPALLALIDLIVLALMSDEKFNLKYNQ